MNWVEVDAQTITLEPSEAVGNWVPIDEKTMTLEPSEAVGNWVQISEMDVTLTPEGVVPPTCVTDTDCPVGYKCVNGKCVKEGPAELRWEWLLIGGGVALAAGMLLAKKQPPEKGA